MTSVLFQDILKKSRSVAARASQQGIKRPEGALPWFRKQVRALAQSTKASPEEAMNGMKSTSTSKKSLIGSMVVFVYDPKYKETLPYYDTFPLVFPFNADSNSFIGINLHYLDPMSRAKLMDALYDIKGKDNRLALSYNILNSAGRFELFKPCVKRYLISHLRSGVNPVDYEEWDAALMVPTARFQKASERKVWDDSLRKVAG